MSVTVDNLLHQAMSLPEEDRALLAEKLLDSVDEKEVLRAWAEEAARRFQEMERGDVRELTPEEVMQYIQERRNATKAAS